VGCPCHTWENVDCQQKLPTKVFLLQQLGAGDRHLVKAPRKLGHNILFYFIAKTKAHTYIVVKVVGHLEEFKR